MSHAEIEQALSSLLGIPRPYVYDKSDDYLSMLSEIAFKELSGLVELPDGYDLTDLVRVPKQGEFFLDIRSLVETESVVVYKAIDTIKNVNLILKPVSSGVELDKSNSFDFFLCMLQGGIARYQGSLVRVLIPAIDNMGNVVVVKDNNFMVVNIDSLEHVNKSSDLPEEIDFNHMLGQQKDINLPKPKNKYKNRFDITFDDFSDN